jgi:hypothetical protein
MGTVPQMKLCRHRENQEYVRMEALSFKVLVDINISGDGYWADD